MNLLLNVSDSGNWPKGKETFQSVFILNWISILIYVLIGTLAIIILYLVLRKKK
jgi:hypothetical protein